MIGKTESIIIGSGLSNTYSYIYQHNNFKNPSKLNVLAINLRLYGTQKLPRCLLQRSITRFSPLPQKILDLPLWP